MNHQFPLPVINDAALQKFCKEHNLYEAIAVGYRYAHKFFPTAKSIEIDFHPPYRDDEPEEADIIFLVKADMTIEEALNAEDRFIKATNNIPGMEYIVVSTDFVS